jgi:hypothetical protein
MSRRQRDRNRSRKNRQAEALKPKPPVLALDGLNRDQLRSVAAAVNVDGRGRMTRDELVRAIAS